MPARIFVKRSRQVHIEVDTKQVVDRVSVFLTAETVVRDWPSLGHPRGFAFLDSRREPIDNCPQFLGLGLRFFRGRHLAGVQPEDDFGPSLRRGLIDEFARESIEPKLAFLLLGIMTTLAICREKRLNARVKPSRFCRECRARRARK